MMTPELVQIDVLDQETTTRLKLQLILFLIWNYRKYVSLQ